VIGHFTGALRGHLLQRLHQVSLRERPFRAIRAGVEAKPVEVIDLANHGYPLQCPFGALRVRIGKLKEVTISGIRTGTEVLAIRNDQPLCDAPSANSLRPTSALCALDRRSSQTQLQPVVAPRRQRS
jgi:hypothetical protein